MDYSNVIDDIYYYLSKHNVYIDNHGLFNDNSMIYFDMNHYYSKKFIQFLKTSTISSNSESVNLFDYVNEIMKIFRIYSYNDNDIEVSSISIVIFTEDLQDFCNLLKKVS